MSIQFTFAKKRKLKLGGSSKAKIDYPGFMYQIKDQTEGKASIKKVTLYNVPDDVFALCFADNDPNGVYFVYFKESEYDEDAMYKVRGASKTAQQHGVVGEGGCALELKEDYGFQADKKYKLEPVEGNEMAFFIRYDAEPVK